MTAMANLKQAYEKPLSSLDRMGEELAFYLRALRATPRSVTRYPKEILRLLAEVTLGSGALAVIGGTVGVITAMTFFTGAQVGLSGYAALDQIGTAAFAGFVSAYFNTREIAPLVAGIALAATVGCGFTAQLGAMRISEEVDALEVMAIPSMPFLVTTRIVAGLVAIVPLYVVGLLSSYFATRTTVTLFYGQSPGTYDHYFNQFLALVLRQGGGVLGRGDPDPLLPRLHRRRRASGSGRGRGPRGAHLDRGGERDRPVPLHGDLGIHDHGQIGGLSHGTGTHEPPLPRCGLHRTAGPRGLAGQRGLHPEVRGLRAGLADHRHRRPQPPGAG
jgi:phospholipid/cholesterol/gamma-HCH transport system permease protein